MAKKALIVYASVTGNTEKVAMKFQETFVKKGWKCDTCKVTKRTDRTNPPVHLEDHDILCVGAPIWAGIPPLYLFDDHLGALGPIMRPPTSPGERRRSDPAEPYGTKKGIVFVTYGGDRRGSEEALPALSCLQLRLEDARIKCVGKFACPGGLWAEPPVDSIAARFDWMVGDATIAIARYKENPNDPEFANLSAVDRKLFERAVKDTTAGGFRTGGWHWDLPHRPNERDLLKAQIFLEEILEDYYEDGIERYPFAQYICIS